MIENVDHAERIKENFWPIRRQYPMLKIPETWGSLLEFMTWFMNSGKPMLIPVDAETIRTDDATAITLFRKGAYQVELYLIHPGYTIPVHSHPGMEVITMYLGGGALDETNPRFGTSASAGKTSRTLEGEYHGGQPTDHGKGFALLSFERWLHDGAIPTSAALQWKGSTAGPVHDALINSKFDGGIKVPGEFDISTYKEQTCLL
jgi:hypothetical protein